MRQSLFLKKKSKKEVFILLFGFNIKLKVLQFKPIYFKLQIRKSLKDKVLDS
jgi:hypothetical protein